MTRKSSEGGIEMQSIIESIKNQSETNPSKLCIADFNGVSYTYGEYWSLIKNVSRYILQMGVKEKDCVIVESFQSGLFTAFGLGIQLAGGIFVPVEKNLAIERIFEIQADTNAKYIFCNEKTVRNDSIILTSHVLKQLEIEEYNDPNDIKLP